MDTYEPPAFDINYHRYVASRIACGRAMPDTVAASQEMLLAEVERLTYLVSPAKLKQPTRGETVEVSNLIALIDALAKHPKNASVVVEALGMKSHPGEMGSYRGYYDQLSIEPKGREPKTVADVLKELRSIRKKGIIGDGGPYEVKPFTGVWIAEYGDCSQQHLSGVRVDGGVVVIMTEERDW
ncbi:MAG TPA: hypothetical protein VF867_14310 [Arthrobacter sp.]